MPISCENPTGVLLAGPAEQKGSIGPLWKLSRRWIRLETRDPGRADSDLTEWLALAFEELRAIYIQLMDLAGCEQSKPLYKYSRQGHRVSEDRNRKRPLPTLLPSLRSPWGKRWLWFGGEPLAVSPCVVAAWNLVGNVVCRNLSWHEVLWINKWWPAVSLPIGVNIYHGMFQI